MHPDEITFAELLKPAGYRTFAVGKWHLGFNVEGAHPMDQGFDSYYGCPHNYGDQSQATGQALVRDREIEKEVSFQELTQSYNREVVNFIERQSKEQPFFIYMVHQIAHSLILPSQDFKGSTNKGIYADFVSERGFSPRHDSCCGSAGVHPRP
ncbi:sulfatase-like hydrolase/transferase [Coraliomargarita sp. SDUM461003]|uniref:Sulfatase-like hydrolase/transferase n=1 Tax=Thalassobacterium maritimum TaxID=3041265 RepID=A0ABU1ATK2_9BACT|nr:sulfatase-like hydrolase/transferase [Coraliomargarita sp. SDUM461003]MDQ8207393.1 sulfatase-like hydrolase/transferase [Coraliomargarita sp. SDUM461003]